MKVLAQRADRPVEAIINHNRNRIVREPANQIREMPIRREDRTSHRVAEVGHQVVHDQHLHIMGMMMEEVSNKIHIKLSSTSQSQIRTHESISSDPNK